MIMLMLMLVQISVIDNVNNIKDLGIIMSSNCSFEQHITELCKWCTGLCGWIIRTFSSRESTELIIIINNICKAPYNTIL